MFKKILIANRGEIACRVIQTCKKMGIKKPWQFIQMQMKMLYMLTSLMKPFVLVDQALQKVTLLIEKIIDACKKTKADAVHPGYGFLSENEEFAKALGKKQHCFYRPQSQSNCEMGDKIESKKLLKKQVSMSSLVIRKQ
ncbi:MAG: hypothetical protein Ct9H90mP13_12700 [Pseudomonadota bacterium]|nr:MAG: hypothetical protein Ct9H90mP13_12700 [Pseudomonadota bacterium]